eukprot:17167-Heterococcus_DN1.PRE.5
MSVGGSIVLGITASAEQYHACLTAVVLPVARLASALTVDGSMVARSTQLAPLALPLWQIN